jgi:anaerobic magnesium-protoporphyrin IX monomethyl ester cyclase
MHITLIRPTSMTSLGTFSSVVIPSIGLAYLSANIKANGLEATTIDAIGEAIDQITLFKDEGYQTRGLLIDEIIEKIPKYTDFIGVSAMFSIEWPMTQKIIKAIKLKYPETPIILGGEHATSTFVSILKSTPEVDFCILGEGEETIIQLMNESHHPENIPGIAYRKDLQIVQTMRRARLKEIEKIPRPDWESIPLENYFNSKYSWTPTFNPNARNMVILATRGCPYECTFCSNPEMWTTKYNIRPVADVIDELIHYMKEYKITGFDFCDLTAVFHKKWIIEFTTLLIEKDLKLTWAPPVGTRSEVFSAEVVRLMRKSGCSYINFSPESGSPEILKKIKKRINLHKMFESIKYCKNEKLPVRINLIIGFPFEKRKHILQTIFFQWKVALAGGDDSIIHFFSPYPGSEIFNDLVKDGTIKDLDKDYYKSLMSYMDLNTMTNFCKSLGMRELGFYRLIGMLGFYLISYLFYPWRILRTIKCLLNITTSHSILEQRLIELAVRKRSSKDSSTIGNYVHPN